ncbi:MAG: hypothetical protein WBN18_12130, partial [Flavobacteriaceae bacterium]
INASEYLLLFLLIICIQACEGYSKKISETKSGDLQFDSSNQKLTEAFHWAKGKALSYAHDGTDPVGFWYEAALPDREAFCMRDVAHQAIGAEILGLGKHNYNMFLKFAQNISVEKDYCTYWEINRYDKPAPIDYENDQDFWYNLPANFDIVQSGLRLYQWTGNQEYLTNPDLNAFYELSMNAYIDHWDLADDKILGRNRMMHLKNDRANSRFGTNRGIPTYNEGGRGETLLGIDLTASMIAAYRAYSEILKLNGVLNESEAYREKAQRTQEFLESFWWDATKQEYRSIYYSDGSFDYFWVGEQQAFLHYLMYFDAIADDGKKMKIVNDYEENFDRLIVELKSYIPIIFYENGKSEIADRMIVDLCSPENQRRDYPENSFTVIEHITRGLMGIDVDASSNRFSTEPRLAKEADWAELKHVPLLSNKVSVKHFGRATTTAKNESGGTVGWTAKIPGVHSFLFLDGQKTECGIGGADQHAYSYLSLTLKAGKSATVSIDPPAK